MCASEFTPVHRNYLCTSILKVWVNWAHDISATLCVHDSSDTPSLRLETRGVGVTTGFEDLDRIGQFSVNSKVSKSQEPRSPVCARFVCATFLFDF